METLNNLITVQIPFDGFYNTLSGDNLDTMRYSNDYENEDYELVESVQDTALKYANMYADNFIELLKDNGINVRQYKFASLISPRFYNYITDKIYVQIDRDAMVCIMIRSKLKLAQAIKDLGYDESLEYIEGLSSSAILADTHYCYLFMYAFMLSLGYDSVSDLVDDVTVNWEFELFINEYFYNNVSYDCFIESAAN